MTNSTPRRRVPTSRLLTPARALLALVPALALGLGACQLQTAAPPTPTGATGGNSGEAQSKVETKVSAVTLTGFTDNAVITGRLNPVAVRFASNGKIFIAEEAGRIWVYNSLTDTAPKLFADIRDKVNSYWDRGMLGFTIDPNYPTKPYIYVLYSHDQSTAAENGKSIAGRNTIDDCPSPPGGTSQGCVTFGRLSRITDDSNYPETNETVLVDEWGQQFPSHSIGTLMFGPDGALYATGGDGASFGTQDYGQFGIPLNPLADPPAGSGGTMTKPTARGGALRAQSMRRPTGEPVRLNGSLIRIDPSTGFASAGNPNIGSSDLNARRILAFGLRNPYRFTVHPTTGDIWIGDVGDSTWEELDRIPAPVTGKTLNFGWPCYEGAPKHPAWDALNLDMCETLYTAPAGTYTQPYWAYHHDQVAFTGDTCTPGTNGSATAGVTFYQSGNYPAAYQNALFMADHARNCIWVMKAGSNGLPNAAGVTTFISAAAHPSDLQIGPNGDMFYTDYEDGELHRVRYQAPTAVATATPTAGNAPLTVAFSAANSTPGVAGDTLTYAWDLDGDGVFTDSTSKTPSKAYTTTGTYAVRVKVTDQRGGFDTSPVLTITVGSTSTPPVPVIDTPASTLTYAVNDTISFSGHATDVEDGNLPASALYWEVVVNHCPAAGCHEHLVQTFDGVTSGSFPAPDHEYPSYITLRVTATDSAGAKGVTSIRLDPKTVDLSFTSSPATSPGLQISFNSEVDVTPFTHTVIVGSANTVNAFNQSAGTSGYQYQSWSDGGDQEHIITAGTANAAYAVTFVPSVWSSQDIGATGVAGSSSENSGTFSINGAGADIYGTADAFRYVYQPITGDATITARVTGIQNTNAFAKAGVMFRQTLDAGSVNVHALAEPVNTSLLRYIVRPTANGASTTETGPSSDLPAWVRVARVGNVFTAYSSTNGTTWTQMGTPKTFAMGTTIYVGMAVTSHVAGTLCSATFDNVTLTTPAPPGPPGAPAGLAATAGNAQVSLTWTASSGATSYTVKRATTSGGPYTTVTTVAGNSYTNTGLSNGTTYYFVVTASNSAGESGNSNQASAAPSAAIWLDADIGTTGATGSSSQSAGTFTVKGAGADIYGTADAFHYTYQNVTGDATITARVSSIQNVNVWSKAGVMVRETTAAGATNVLALTSPTTTNLYRLQTRPTTGGTSNSASGGSGANPVWLRVTRAGNTLTGFFSANGTAWTQLGATTTIAMASTVTMGLAVTSHTAGTLASGVFDNVSITFPAPAQPPAAPTGLTATPGNGQVALSWTAAGGATSYTVKSATASGGPYTNVQTGITGTTYTNSGLTNGTAYYFVVSASNTAGEGANSAEATATPVLPPPPAAPAGLTATAGNAQVALTWTAVSGATSYTVKSATTAGGPYSNVNTVTTTSYTDSALVNGTTYYYVVSATGVGGESANSGEASATPTLPPPPATPAGLAAAPGNNQVTLTWSAASGATGYNIKRASTTGGPYSIVKSQAGTSYVDGGLTNGTTYYYVVSATNLGGESADSTEVFATPVQPPPGAPTNLSATSGNAQVALSWSAVSGSTSYTVKRSTVNGGPYTAVQTGVTTTSYTNTGLTNGTTYYFVVTATGPGGESGNSAQVTGLPVAPVTWQSQDIGTTGATGSWSQAGGVYTVKGAGADIYGTADAFRYVYQPVTGDATITARVASVQNTQAFAKAGVMFRKSLAANSMNVHAFAEPVASSLMRYIVRTTDGGSATTETGPAQAPPAWVRVKRVGNVFTAYSSVDGTTWTQMGTPKTIAMGTTIYVGMAVTSHAAGTLCTSTFDNVTITQP